MNAIRSRRFLVADLKWRTIGFIRSTTVPVHLFSRKKLEKATRYHLHRCIQISVLPIKREPMCTVWINARRWQHIAEICNIFRSGLIFVSNVIVDIVFRTVLYSTIAHAVRDRTLLESRNESYVFRIYGDKVSRPFEMMLIIRTKRRTRKIFNDSTTIDSSEN